MSNTSGVFPLNEISLVLESSGGFVLEVAMKPMASRKRHSAEDSVRRLHRADELAAEGKTGDEVAAELRVSAAALNNWRHAHGGMNTDACRSRRRRPIPTPICLPRLRGYATKHPCHGSHCLIDRRVEVGEKRGNLRYCEQSEVMIPGQGLRRDGVAESPGGKFRLLVGACSKAPGTVWGGEREMFMILLGSRHPVARGA
jgi:hypothetical protein